MLTSLEQRLIARNRLFEAHKAHRLRAAVPVAPAGHDRGSSERRNDRRGDGDLYGS